MLNEKPNENKKGGKPPTAKLFIEVDPSGEYSLKEWRRVFVDIADPTEYEAAILLAGSWEHWCILKKHWPHFRDSVIPAWLEEVEVKLRSAAVKNIITQSKSDKSTTAAKWLAEGKYNLRGPGKPSKAEVTREARIAAGVSGEIEGDIERVLSAVNSDR
jgi:hypothetical protein